MYDCGVIEALETAVENLDIAVDGDDIARALKVIDRLTAKVTVAIGEFDDNGLWDLDGRTSMTDWLVATCNVRPGLAKRMSGDAAKLRMMPATRGAWLEGRLVEGQVQAVLQNTDAHTRGLWADQEADLVPVLEPLSVKDAADVMQAWKQKADAVVDRPEPKDPKHEAHFSKLLDGRSHLSADLDDHATPIAEAALEAASSPDAEGESRTPAQRRCRDFHRRGATAVKWFAR